MEEPIQIEGISGFLRGKKFSFQEQEIFLGTDADCHIRLDPTWDKSVSGRHATLRCIAGTWLLEDHSKDGTYVAGRKISREKLQPETTLELGRGGPRLKISLPTPLAHPQASPLGTDRKTPKSSVRRRLVAFAAVGVVLLGVAALVGDRFKWGAFTDAKSNLQPAALAPRGEEVPNPKTTMVAEWNVVADMGEQVYPSFLIASATMKQSPLETLNTSNLRLGDKRGVLGVEITNPGPDTKVRVEFEENEIMRASVFEGVLSEPGSVYRIYPQVNYRYDALGRFKQTTPLSLSARVGLNGGASTQRSKAVRVASINECPFLMVLPGEAATEEYVPMLWMFAAYVNENHPVSDELRKEALKLGIVRMFGGYQGGRMEVYKQVFAIWNALQRRGVRYSDITTTPTVSEEVRSQHVRFIDQSINNTQANCVDGSVLFASVLRQIGIEPLLVLVPGHMFVGFALDPEGTEVDYLETTMIGNIAEAKQRPQKALAAVDPARSIGAIRGLLEPVVEVALSGDSSLDSFVGALQTARSTVEEYFEAGERSVKISSHRAPTIRRAKSASQRIFIQEARQLGVMPIGYQP